MPRSPSNCLAELSAGRHAATEESGKRGSPHSPQDPMRDGDSVGVDAPVGRGGGPPSGRTPLERLRVVELEAVDPVLVDIDHDRVAVLDKGDRPAEESFRA